MSSQWPGQVYRRYSVDIHIPDWNPALLSNFDAAQYVGTIARGGALSLLHYTNSHVGLCLWNTKIGPRHANMPKGRDFFGEVVGECRRQGVHPLAYFSLIHDNWNYEHHPDWRIARADGVESRLLSRYGVCCPNSPYRDYVLACMREIVSGYDIQGVFYDMTFWPEVCYCPHCTARFLAEEGREAPRVVDWDDPIWRAWQAARQRWLREFAMDTTNIVKTVKPITVNHQLSTIFHNWTLGVPLEMTDACDYVGGDFYGGPAQHSLACKVYNGLTRHKPFEFHTSRTRIYSDHVTVKPMEEIRTEAFVATLHHAALMLVDYINADGTLNPEVYAFLGQLSAQRAAYEPFLGGELMADMAIYFDKESMYNPDENGVHVLKLRASDRCPHRDAVIGMARVLQQAHIPFGVVTNANLDQLGRYRAVILPNVLEMSSEQAETFRRFVADGGALYASGSSSLDRANKCFLLEDVLGAHYLGRLGTKITYLTPDAQEAHAAIWPQDHVSFAGPMISAEVLPGAEVLAHVTLPFVEPELGTTIGSRFAAIHSNPPALKPESNPAIVAHRYGKGQVAWVAAPVESTDEKVNHSLVKALLHSICPGPYCLEIDAHPAIEATLFHQPEQHRYVVSLLNLQQQLPQVPVGAALKVQLKSGQMVKQMLRVPDQHEIPYQVTGEQVAFLVEPFDTFAMMLIDYSASL
ncbi:MAG: alpha-L-fucosidase [Chloroflexi bacterium]|nr:alpha-L-fucosidase [Chloroflexota bacterium]